MAVVEGFRYVHHVVQQSEPDREGWEEDKLLIIFKLFKISIRRRHSHARIHYRDKNQIDEKDMWASFSDFKHQVSASNPNRNTEVYEQQICSYLSTMSVPEDKHPAIIQKLFRVVEAAETSQVPVIVNVWHAHGRIGPYTRRVGRQVGPKFTPAATSAIEGLRSLVHLKDSVFRQTPSCAICLEDFDVLDQQELPITGLPCQHHFHVHCIVQCLEISHLCPLCRYAMPTQED
ncbi:PREDICTED: uncharacterized protein LOC101305399 [Fragaria vesca subsp. vesca]|uniref:uncharacterized protein LOC101305399 n=1 Tax=Fragaria vesca subsp. vesca TaxID=101020 RepID=UPI0002C34F03|nr:PREDICTED: uncharacterized protein LOC101305399 [Fragaria vesca subsp. vesca]